MATIVEKYDSRPQELQADSAKLSLRFLVKTDPATESEADVWGVFGPAVPQTNQDFPLKAMRIEPQGAGLYICIADYEDSAANNQPQSPGDSSTTFDTTGGTAHLSHSRETVKQWQAIFNELTGVRMPEFENGIGVTRTSIEGVDIVVPAYHFQIPWLLPVNLVTNDYIRRLRRLTGTVNKCIYYTTGDDLVQEFFPGELRFDGVRGSKKKHDMWELIFNFSAQENVDVAEGIGEPIFVGNIIVEKKNGWDYLWVFCTERVDQSSRFLVRLPVCVNIERVYRYEEFAQLHPLWVEDPNAIPCDPDEIVIPDSEDIPPFTLGGISLDAPWFRFLQ